VNKPLWIILLLGILGLIGLTILASFPLFKRSVRDRVRLANQIELHFHVSHVAVSPLPTEQGGGLRIRYLTRFSPETIQLAETEMTELVRFVVKQYPKGEGPSRIRVIRRLRFSSGKIDETILTFEGLRDASAPIRPSETTVKE